MYSWFMKISLLSLWLEVRELNSKRRKFTRSRSMSHFSGTTSGTFVRTKSGGGLRKCRVKAVKKSDKCRTRTYALVIWNCNSTQESMPIHSGEPSDRAQTVRITSRLSFAVVTVVKAYLDWLVRVLAASTPHIPDPHTPCARRVRSRRVKGWNASERERT